MLADTMRTRQLAYRASGTERTLSVERLTSEHVPWRPLHRGAASPGATVEFLAVPTKGEYEALLQLDAFVKGLRHFEPFSRRLPESMGDVLVVRGGAENSLTIPTPTVVVETPPKADLDWAKDHFGAVTADEGVSGWVLLAVSEAAEDPLGHAFALARELQRRGLKSASPNFIRAALRPQSAAVLPARPWAHESVRVEEAWGVTRGSERIRVAVLDDGVECSHPALRHAIVAQRSFIGAGGDSAEPEGNDAHGTACAGIVVSNAHEAPGIAPGVGLIATRVATSRQDGRVTAWEDIKIADGIKWAVARGADVLSLSCCGGDCTDALASAVRSARLAGRNGKGCIIAIAAGNAESAIEDFPGRLEGVLTVGAENQYRERKTKRSRDGELWWGSNFGPTLSLLAPGVAIHTTDLVGDRGMRTGSNYVSHFNGTSAATPHVAAAAALLLSVAPHLSGRQVRYFLRSTATRVPGRPRPSPEEGHGRLNIGEAVRRAQSVAPEREHE